MKQAIYILFSVLQLCSFAQKKVGGIEVPTILKTESTVLVLNGAGVREKYYKDLYVLALYVKTRSDSAHQIMFANEPMAFKMHIVSSLISGDRMEEVTDEGFKRATENNIEPIREKIDQFKSVFKDNVKKGDVYEFVYLPLKGTHIYKNNVLSSIIPGLDFKKALFGIWLFKRPKDTDLHDKLLGK